MLLAYLSTKTFLQFSTQFDKLQEYVVNKAAQCYVHCTANIDKVKNLH